MSIIKCDGGDGGQGGQGGQAGFAVSTNNYNSNGWVLKTGTINVGGRMVEVSLSYYITPVLPPFAVIHAGGVSKVEGDFLTVPAVSYLGDVSPEAVPLCIDGVHHEGGAPGNTAVVPDIGWQSGVPVPTPIPSKGQDGDASNDNKKKPLLIQKNISVKPGQQLNITVGDIGTGSTGTSDSSQNCGPLPIWNKVICGSPGLKGTDGSPGKSGGYVEIRWNQ